MTFSDDDFTRIYELLNSGDSVAALEKRIKTSALSLYWRRASGRFDLADQTQLSEILGALDRHATMQSERHSGPRQHSSTAGEYFNDWDQMGSEGCSGHPLVQAGFFGQSTTADTASAVWHGVAIQEGKRWYAEQLSMQEKGASPITQRDIAQYLDSWLWNKGHRGRSRQKISHSSILEQIAGIANRRKSGMGWK